MTTSIPRVSSDMPIPPGEVLAEEIEARGMTQRELAARLGRPAQVVNEIIRAKKAITPETAIELGNVLGTTARFWMNLESEYRMILARKREREILEANASWLDEYPVREMIKRGWMEKGLRKPEKLKALQKYFEVAVPEPRAYQEAIGLRIQEAARVKISPGALSVWLREGEIQARSVDTAEYNEEVFSEVLNSIRNYTGDRPREFIPKMSKLCSDAGVVFCMVQELRKSGAIVATRWMNDRKALIQMSTANTWADRFWFIFYRESLRLLQHRKQIRIVIPGFNEDSDGPETEPGAEDSETEANFANSAWDLLIDPGAWRAFCNKGRYDPDSVKHLAHSVGISPSILVGRMQRERRIATTQLKSLRRQYDWKRELSSYSSAGRYTLLSVASARVSESSDS